MIYYGVQRCAVFLSMSNVYFIMSNVPSAKMSFKKNAIFIKLDKIAANTQFFRALKWADNPVEIF